ncbi:hypothetical protein COLO4_06478 [Corchorus olitorius]|uniref:DUF4283 domain-containing protein n=1 Tax=Corchorus olitorius TaxID=93759 RepID=A0A1R3KMY5_9ROSI|nr:hypothetical protein COLO4_06478 [Corchorus olitorius]
MAGTLSNLCSKLSLKEGEEDTVVIANELLDGAEGEEGLHGLVGKLYTKKHPNMEGLRNAFIQAWKLDYGLGVMEVGENLFLFQFEDELEKDRVLVHQPWNFNRLLMVFRDYDENQHPESMSFDLCPFWVRIFNLPLKVMNEKVGIVIGETLGPVLEVDLSSGRFLRLRVEINVLSPLKDTLKISLPSGDLEVECRYEKMPAHCRVCGMVIHTDLDYPLGVSQLKNQGFMDRKFEGKLQVESPVNKSGRFVRQESSFRMAGVCSSYMGDGSEVPRFRSHVDSLLLRGRRAARAIAAEDVSCEIVKVVTRNADQAEENEVTSRRNIREGGDPVSQSVNRGSELRGKTQQLGTRASPNPGKGKDLRMMREESSESLSSSNFFGNFHEGGPSFRQSNLGPMIPGVGPVIRSPKQVGPSVSKVGQGGRSASNSEHIRRADSFIPLEEAYSPTEPFVFGASSAIPSKRIRKWKKTAIVSSNYSFDVLGPASNFQVGQKRSSHIPVLDVNLHQGPIKRSREVQYRGSGVGGGYQGTGDAGLVATTDAVVGSTLNGDLDFESD